MSGSIAWQEPHPQRLPSPDEIIHNLAKIREADSRIKQLAAQIQELQQSLKETQCDRDNRVSFLSPFRRLPPEILGQIAVCCLAAKGGPKPSQLNQVSKPLRAAVNGMKTLWSTIWLKAKDSKSEWETAIPCATLSYLRLVLERAAPASLTVIVEGHAMSTLPQVLALYDGYIKRLILGDKTGGGSLFLVPFSSFPSLNLTGIQTLETVGENTQGFPMWSFLDMAMHSSRSNLTLRLAFWQPRELPRLIDHPIMQRIVTLEIRLAQKSSQIFTFSQSSIPQLTELILRGNLDILSYSIPRLRALRICHVLASSRTLHPRLLPPTLEELYLEALSLSGRVQPSDIRHFDLLTCLTIRHITVRDPSCQWFDMPHLEELTLSTVIFNGRESIPTPMIGQDAILGYLPSLKRLWVHDLRTPFLNDFSPCPNLIALRMTHCKYSNFLLNSLMTDDGSVPHLNEFLIQEPRGVVVAGEFMRECARNRPGLRIIDDINQCRHLFKVGLSTY